MSILTEIDDLQKRVLDALSNLPLRSDQLEAAIERALLERLDLSTIERLSSSELDRVIQDALSEVTSDMSRQVRQSVADRTKAVTSATRDFYTAQGVAVPDDLIDAVRRTESAQRLATFLEDGMQQIDRKLLDSTVETVQEAIAKDELSEDVLRERIQNRASASTANARTQARTSISSYNQLYRSELADRAELKHFLYYGNVQDNTRPFCRARAGNVYTEEQIADMDNGQVGPVRLFTGGYNCRHSWVPVDPEWDDDLKDRLQT